METLKGPENYKGLMKIREREKGGGGGLGKLEEMHSE